MITIPVRIPFNPKKIPFFYGWIVLAAGVIGIIMSIPGQTMGVSVFTESLIHDLNLSRDQLSIAYMVGTMLSGFLITYAGILYDKAGARIIAIGAGVMLGVVLLYLSRIEIIADFFINLFHIEDKEKILFGAMVIGFFGIRFFGQGVLTMTSRNMVMKWFDVRRGFANGFLGVFTAIAFAYSPNVLSDILNDYGWKKTYLILAVLLFIFVIFAFIVFRDNPLDSGLIPDGKKVKPKLKGIRSTSVVNSDLKDVIKTFSFWIFTLNIAIIALTFTAFTFHVESVFAKHDMSSETAFKVFLPSAVIAAFVHIGGSWISDYIKLKNILILSYAGSLIGLMGMLFLGKLGPTPLIIGNGIIIGTYNIIIALTWPRFYGLKHLGKISGFVISCGVIGSSVGPFIFSTSERLTGNYSIAIIILLSITFLLFLSAFWANNINDKSLNEQKNTQAE